jgi:hypothetical protein
LKKWALSEASLLPDRVMRNQFCCDPVGKTLAVSQNQEIVFLKKSLWRGFQDGG